MKSGFFKSTFALSTALTLSMGLTSPASAQVAAGGDATPTDPASATPAPTSSSPATPTTAAHRPAPATAADTGPTDIIVTARRTEERLQDVPISITVFNQQQITNRNVVNSTDLAAYTPSLSSNANFGIENATFAIRGFVQDPGTSPSVGVYFADVVAPRGPTQGITAGDGAGPGYFFDLQNVQVLKGPQGTLQGRNTTGGAVLFVPQKPTAKLEGYIEGSYGNYDMKRLQAMINVPLSDVARFRIAVDHQDRDGYLHNISGIGPKDYNDVNYTAVRASLVVDLTPELENYTILSYSKSDTNGSVQKTIGCNPTGFDPVDPATGTANFIGVLACGQLAAEKARGAGFYDLEAAVANPVSLLEQWQVINTTTWRPSDTLTVKNIASYAQFTDVQRSALFGTNWITADLPQPYPAIFSHGVPSVFADSLAAPGYDTANQSTATEEFQVQGRGLNDRLTYQAGAYLEISDPLGLVGSESAQLADCTNIAGLQCTDPIGETFGVPVGAVNYTVGKTRYHDVGLYAQSTYKLTDKLSLTGGFRYTWDSQTNTSTRITYQFDITPPYTGAPVGVCTDVSQEPTCKENLKEKSNKPTWLIDLDYKPNQNILLYAKYARGYRAGGIFANAPEDHRAFGPEKVDSYEAGIKTTLRGALHGTFDVSAFYNDFSNQQLELGFIANPNYGGPGIPAPVSPTEAVVNAGKSRIYGVEVESSITPFKGFTLDASYTYLNATLRKLVPFGTTDPLYVAGASSLQPGYSLELSPRNKASITGTYTLPLDPAVGRVSVGATFVHTDKQITNYVYKDPAFVALYGADLSDIQATNLLNLNISWNSVAGSRFDLSAFATNVTNVKYYSYIAGSGSAGLETAALGQPRFYGGRIRYRF